MKSWIVAATLGIAALATPAMAQQASGDGSVTRAEFLARAEARFAKIDADRNGVLTREERRTARQAMRAERKGVMQQRRGARGTRMLARLDGDKDGRVSLAEFQSGLARRIAARPVPEGVTAAQRNERMTARFQRWDSNRDGYVDQAEISSIQPRNRRGGAPRADM